MITCKAIMTGHAVANYETKYAAGEYPQNSTELTFRIDHDDLKPGQAEELKGMACCEVRLVLYNKALDAAAINREARRQYKAGMGEKG